MHAVRWTFAVAALLAPGGAALLTHGTARADEPAVEVQADLVFATVDGQELRLDLAKPRGVRGALPAVVVIHGGGWIAGSHKDHPELLPILAQRGYVAASVAYRLAPRYRWPAQIEDVKAAVRWLRTNAERFSIDPDHVGAMGFSAGGHLAMVLGTADPADLLDVDVLPGAPPSKVQSVVSWFGPTDLDAAELSPGAKSVLGALLGPKAVGRSPGHACPLRCVDGADAPMLLFHGTRDPIVPVSQAVNMAEALTKAGVKGEVHLLLGEGHGWKGTTLADTVEDSIRWFDRTLKGVVPPAPGAR